MTKLGRSTTICCLFVALLVFAATSRAQKQPPIAKQIAKAAGLDSFGKIEAIRFTWNLEAGTFKLAHAWVWEPKTDRVSYEGKDKQGNPVKATYLRSELGTAPANVTEQIDPAFVNDQYFFLYPLHVYWDSWADVQDQGMQKLPLEEGSARRVVVKYPSEGGVSPGDTWELYVGSDKRVKELDFHRGGAMKPSRFVSSWKDYKKAGPLVASMDRPGQADGNQARIFFTDVAVKLVGSDKWVEAK